MSFTNIKANNQGFTIVELLIVVVVIAILAAITIVSYNGITSRANASSAASNVETVFKVAEAYNADAGRYPGTKAAFSSGFTDATITTAASKLPNGLTILNPTLATGTAAGIAANTGSVVTASNGTSNVEVYITGTSAASTGGVIVSWDYANNRRQNDTTKYTYYGAANSSSAFIALPN
jgi:prepilin-type N-terminal cleavage/methylation domain-containing protein